MNETDEGLIKYRSPPRTVFVSMCMGQEAVTEITERLLPQLDVPIVLFTGSRDITLPVQRTCGAPTSYPIDHECKYADYSAAQKKSIRRIIESPLVERWMVENLAAPHPPKMAPLPLGFFPPDCQNDRVGTKAVYDAAPDLGSEGVCANVWETIRGDGLNSLLKRPLKMACSGHVRDSPDYHDRNLLAGHCAKGGKWNDLAVAPSDELDFQKFLSFMAGASFVACAHGGGFDPAPKAFEALAAGSIPIIASSALDSAYRKLPVVVVDSFEDPRVISKEKLLEWRQQLAPYFGSRQRGELEKRLTLNFWLGHSLSGTSAALPGVEEADDWWIDARAARSLPLALVHVGPHKMGSTALQTAIATYKDALGKDGFEVPAVQSGRQRLAAAAMSLRCKAGAARVGNATVDRFPCPLECGDPEVKDGWRDLQKTLTSARQTRRSIILSAEDLDLPETNIEDLAGNLHDFNMTTVVMYRPFNEWMVSVHGMTAGHDLRGVRNSGQDVHYLLQCMAEDAQLKDGEMPKHRCRELVAKNLSDVAEQYTPLVEWMTEDRIQRFLPTFSSNLVSRYSRYGEIRTQQISSDASPHQLVKDFFCRGWTPHTCAAVHERLAREDLLVMGTDSANAGGDEVDVQALEVAIEAMRAGWLPTTISALDAARHVKRVVLDKQLEVPMRCLRSSGRGHLLRQTLSSGEALSGQLPFDEHVTRSMFWHARAASNRLKRGPPLIYAPA
jgi:hypothetical protein